MSKKRAKNSDYHYAERRDNAARIEAQKAQVKKTSRRERLMYLGALVLLIVAMIVWIATRKSGMGETFAPLYGSVSGIGLILLSFSYKKSKDKASKACLIIGIIALVLSALVFLINMGVLNLG